MTRPPHRSTLFPYTTLFRSTDEDVEEYVMKIAQMLEVDDVLDKLPSELSTGMKRAVAIGRALAQNPEAILFDEPTTMVRSEEHTSELQSHHDLVCRLLLEKK